MLLFRAGLGAACSGPRRAPPTVEFLPIGSIIRICVPMQHSPVTPLLAPPNNSQLPLFLHLSLRPDASSHSSASEKNPDGRLAAQQRQYRNPSRPQPFSSSRPPPSHPPLIISFRFDAQISATCFFLLSSSCGVLVSGSPFGHRRPRFFPLSRLIARSQPRLPARKHRR